MALSLLRNSANVGSSLLPSSSTGVLPQTYTSSISPSLTFQTVPGYTKGVVVAEPNVPQFPSGLTEPPPSTTRGYSRIKPNGEPDFREDPNGPTAYNDHLQAVIDKTIDKFIERQTKIINAQPSPSEPPTTYTPGATSAPLPQDPPHIITDDKGISVPNQELTGLFTPIEFTGHPNDTTGVSIDSPLQYPVWVLAHQVMLIHHQVHSRDVGIQYNPQYLGFQMRFYPFITQPDKSDQTIAEHYPIPLDGVLNEQDMLVLIMSVEKLQELFYKAAKSRHGLYDKAKLQEHTNGGFGSWFSNLPQTLGGSRKRKRTTRKYKNRKLSYKRNNKKRTTKNRRRYSRRK